MAQSLLALLAEGVYVLSIVRLLTSTLHFAARTHECKNESRLGKRLSDAKLNQLDTQRTSVESLIMLRQLRMDEMIQRVVEEIDARSLHDGERILWYRKFPTIEEPAGPVSPATVSANNMV